MNLSLASIRWQCRRGMLELDILLLSFIDAAYERLSIEEQQLFSQLLTYPDQTLYEWFLGRSSSKDANMQDLIQKIRENAWKE